MGCAPQLGSDGRKKGDASELQELPPAFFSWSPRELHSFISLQDQGIAVLGRQEPVSHFSFGLISPTRNPFWKTRIKKAYFLVWYKAKEKIHSGPHVRVGLWKPLNNSKEQHENHSVVAGHGNWEWDEVSGSWIETERNKNPETAEPLHTYAAIPMFCPGSEVQQGCCDYHLMSGLIS